MPEPLRAVLAGNVAGLSDERLADEMCLLPTALGADELYRWIDGGSAVYLYGSLDGMTHGVDKASRDLSGDTRVEQLREQGRYRQDLY